MTMKKMIALAASLLMMGVVASTASAASAAAPEFVAVKKTQFTRNGHPYYIAGANFWYGAYLGANDRPRLLKELDTLKSMGINNLRVLAVSEKTDMRSAVRPATTSEPGQYDERLLAGMDFLLAEMARRDMTAVIYLNNFWQWSGGMTQYLNWFAGTPALDPNVTKDYETYMRETARFYTNEKAQAEYRNVIRTLINRRNTVTGKPYAGDPAIMSWQLANEPRPGNGKSTPQEKAIYVKWIADTAAYIRGLDRNHLVSTGSEGLAGSAQDAALFEKAHAAKDVDYLTYHLWPKNWGWIDSKRVDATWSGALEKSSHYLNVHIDYAKKLGKPIVLEEFGMDRDGASLDVKAPTTVRDRFYKEVFEVVVGRAEKGDPVAGFNFWAWGGAGRAAHADYWWKEGNDLMGDPPQEEQGLYSVFDTDASTIALIRRYADRLHALERK
jgi:mannan endo-1,4-beta-mannosidase